MSTIVREVCQSIWEELSETYMKVPTEKEWYEIASNFCLKANFPHCLGAIDGKHIRVIKPDRSGSMFFNYKHFFSIVLMAIVDTNYNYIFIDVGAYGKECDSNVFKESSFWKGLENKMLNLPTPAQLEGSNVDLSYIFVGTRLLRYTKTYFAHSVVNSWM